MKPYKTFWVLLAGAIVLVSASPSAFAQDPFTKLGRGTANVLTGWVEVPKKVYTTSTEQNPFIGMTAGLFRGVGRALWRTGAGAWDILTFPVPAPSDYSTPIEPEYVF